MFVNIYSLKQFNGVIVGGINQYNFFIYDYDGYKSCKW